ncbi:general secretion pathway protein GspB [Geopsychrobacter electrodiphilus]|uniref:general secretion pathway protein GspB n=1 Tax=Geopsychrobacter electrodiphilus TaxID=225196 RepID=UPI00037284B7|nr:general secretion pathway protein GspB [Geopsychrobacter electrodiphilus]
MSFILDALKKSERSRAAGSVPDLQTVHNPTPSSNLRERRQPWKFWLLLALLAVLLLNAGLLLWGPKPLQTEISVTSAEPPATDNDQPTAPTPLTQPALRDVPAAMPQAQTDPVAPHKPRRQASPQVLTVARVPEKATSTTPRLEHAPAASAAPAASSAPATLTPPAGNSLPPSELPAAIRSELPLITISLHYYSGDPRERMARINNKILREGEQLQDGLVLEEIIPSGLIFSYRGYRFKTDRHGSLRDLLDADTADPIR